MAELCACRACKFLACIWYCCKETGKSCESWLSIMASLLVLLWDAATGFHHWSVDFVLPVLYVCAIAATIILALFLCLKPQDYIFYLVLNICFGMMPLILYLFNVLNVVCPSAICAAVSIITMSALIIFKGNALKEELDRRLHI